MAIIPIEHIAMTPDICGGKPHIAGRRITVHNIAVLHVRNGWSVEQIANELELTPAQIHAALSYYHDHKDEIDRSIREADNLARDIGTSVEQLRKRM
jgi:uncharacterized protein (DUF433 family)